MTLPNWTINPYTPLTLGNIETEFGGEGPTNISEYYASPTGYVTPDRKGYPYGVETPIPSEGTIAISNFYGASAVPYTITTDKNNYNEGEIVYFTITAPEPDGNVLFWTIEDSTVEITISPDTLPSGRTKVPYFANVLATGGVGSVTYTVTHGQLPSGLTLFSGNGAIRGRPTGSGNSLVVISAFDQDFNSGAKAYSIRIDPVVILISPSTLPTAYRKVPYSQQIVATGGDSPYVYTLDAGTLPGGLTLSNAGLLSGTPTDVGTYTFTVRATDIYDNTATKEYSLTTNLVIIDVTPETLTNGTKNIQYSVTFEGTGGTAPYAYTRTSGSFPNGLTLNSATGVLSGKPTSPGTSSFTITATDVNTNFGSRSYSLIVDDVVITIDPPTLSDAKQKVFYTATFTANGGAEPYKYTVSSGAIPSGMTLTQEGVLSGRPTTLGPAIFTIRATDVNTNFGDRSYTINVNAVTITVSPTTLPAGERNDPYPSTTISATGGASPYQFTISSGSLPSGLTLDSGSGVLSGTPTAKGTFPITVLATDIDTNTGSRSYNLLINQATITLSPDTLPSGSINVSYSQDVDADGGTAPYVFGLVSGQGSLPPGLTISSSTGVISGKPTDTGTYSFRARATDSNSDIGTRDYSIVVNPVIITITPNFLLRHKKNKSYTASFGASGGVAPYVWDRAAGQLPTGLTLNSSTATLSGTPTVVGTYIFTVRATDVNTNAGIKAYELEIYEIVIDISPVELTPIPVNVQYSRTLSASNGTSPYVFSIDAGSLPPGLTLSTGGIISGRPTSTGDYTFTVRANDSDENTGTRQYVLSVQAVNITVNPLSLGNASLRVPYSVSIFATGGSSPYTYTRTAGTLPPGLTFTGSTDPADLSGAPTSTGTYNFTITATDVNQNSGFRAYQISIEAVTITVSPETLPSGDKGDSYIHTISATGGQSPYTFTVTSGALPGGVSLSSAGSLSGTLTTIGAYTFTITATDSNGNTGERAYNVEVYSNVWVITLTGYSGGTLPGAPPITVDEGTTLTFSILAPGTVPVNSTCYLLVTSPLTASSADFDSAMQQTVTLSGRSGTGTIVIKNDAATEGAENFTVAVGYPAAGTEVVTYGLVNVNDTSTRVPATITISPASLSGGTVGTAYSTQLSASGGVSPYVFSVNSGNLPAGLSMSTAGAITGTPTTATTASFQAKAVDANSDFGTRDYTLTIAAVPAPTPTPTPTPPPAGAKILTINGFLSDGTANFPYIDTLSVTGGTPPYSNPTVLYGTAPGGLSLSMQNSTTIKLSGTPTGNPDSVVFTIKVVDSVGNWGERELDCFMFPLIKIPGGSFTTTKPFIGLAISINGKWYVREGTQFDDLNSVVIAEGSWSGPWTGSTGYRQISYTSPDSSIGSGGLGTLGSLAMSLNTSEDPPDQDEVNSGALKHWWFGQPDEFYESTITFKRLSAANQADAEALAASGGLVAFGGTYNAGGLGTANLFINPNGNFVVKNAGGGTITTFKYSNNATNSGTVTVNNTTNIPFSGETFIMECPRGFYTAATLTVKLASGAEKFGVVTIIN